MNIVKGLTKAKVARGTPVHTILGAGYYSRGGKGVKVSDSMSRYDKSSTFTIRETFNWGGTTWVSIDQKGDRLVDVKNCELINPEVILPAESTIRATKFNSDLSTRMVITTNKDIEVYQCPNSAKESTANSDDNKYTIQSDDRISNVRFDPIKQNNEVVGYYIDYKHYWTRYRGYITVSDYEQIIKNRTIINNSDFNFHLVKDDEENGFLSYASIEKMNTDANSNHVACLYKYNSANKAKYAESLVEMAILHHLSKYGEYTRNAPDYIKFIKYNEITGEHHLIDEDTRIRVNSHWRRNSLYNLLLGYGIERSYGFESDVEKYEYLILDPRHYRKSREYKEKRKDIIDNSISYIMDEVDAGNITNSGSYYAYYTSDELITTMISIYDEDITIIPTSKIKEFL